MQAALDLTRVEGVNRDRDPRVRGAQRRRQQREAGKRRRDGADAQPSGEAAAQRVELCIEAIDIGEDPPGPLEHPLTFRRQPLVALRAPDDGEPHLPFESADPGGERRLRDVARARCATEMLLADECHEVCKMAQIHPVMIDKIYRSFESITLTRSERNAILYT